MRDPPDIRDAEFVRWISRTEELRELVNEVKAFTWEWEVEHAAVRLQSGQTALIRGGKDGIRFGVDMQGNSEVLFMEVAGRNEAITRIEWHTHPRATGPSDVDLEALAVLGQVESIIFEIGGDPNGTLIRPKNVSRQD